MPPRRSGEEEQDEWVSADYRRHRDPLRSPAQPKRPRHAPELAPPACGRYGALRDDVPEEDMGWDLEGPDGDPMEDFRISPTGASASRSRQHCKEEEYTEGVRRRVLGGAYVEEPWCSCLHFDEEIDVAAVGTHGRRRWEPQSTLRPLFMVSKAADAAVWEDLKDIRPVPCEPPQI